MLKTWKSSEDYPELTAELLQTEIDQSWILEFEGDEAEASQQYPCGVGLGKLGIAFSDSRPPRLVLDSSICDTNQNCWIPEHQCYPSARGVLESFPLRNCSEPQHAATFDVKSAHKRIVLAEHHRGLVGFTFQKRIFFYKVCHLEPPLVPFGGVDWVHGSFAFYIDSFGFNTVFGCLWMISCLPNLKQYFLCSPSC